MTDVTSLVLDLLREERPAATYSGLLEDVRTERRRRRAAFRLETWVRIGCAADEELATFAEKLLLEVIHRTHRWDVAEALAIDQISGQAYRHRI